MARIGIMSFAHMHAYSYAACLDELVEAELIAIWDDNHSRGKKAAKQFNTAFVAELDKFLALDMQGVIVTSENVRHREMVEAAAAAGKWVLCEKPLAPTVADAKAVIAACRHAKVGLGTAFPVRYSIPMMAVRQMLKSGEYGEIYAASCTNNGQFPGGWFAKQALSGGGATMDHTVHAVDALRWMTGREITHVYSENGNLLRHGIDTDDVGSLHLEMEGGIQVSHVASWNRPKSFPTWGDVTFEIVCEKGVIRVDAFNQKISVYNDDAVRAEWAYWGGNPDLGLIQDFVAAVDERREPTVTGVDGLRAVEVTVAAYKSAAAGKMVRI
ncbi:MAG: Gfo/Idh/MocA family oxidoreductase [Candidatus Hydrogenedentes bacterium]|nr:Gfo/Idh/MocA family oxidoreductase [Candidatus Hydrogenedentota bacterium]